MRIEIVLEDRPVERGRDPDFVLRRGEIEILREDADDGVRLPVHNQGLTQDVGLHRKFLSPKRVAENDHAILAGFPFLFEKRAAENELEPERREKRRRNLLTEDQLRFTPAGESKTVTR